MYDGFIQLYFLLQQRMDWPLRLNSFIGQGIVSKLFILPDIVASYLYVTPLIVLGVTLLATITNVFKERSVGARLLPMLAVILLAEAALHVTLWLGDVHVSAGTTGSAVLTNYLRDFVYGGSLLASGVLLLTTAVSVGALHVLRGESERATAVAGFAAIAVLIAASAPVWVEARLGADKAPGLPGRNTLVEDYNVVFISIDSLRADHLSAYGYQRDTTPTLKTLAAAGVRFDNCSSTTSWTLPAHMSMLTGRSLLGHGVVADDRALTDDVPTLAEQFQAAGYLTKAITSAPYLEEHFGFSRGFDDYDDKTVRFESNEESYKSVTAPDVQKAAAKFLEANSDKKFFLFLHYWDVHYDYTPGEPYASMFDPDYDGEINGENFYFNSAVNKNISDRDLEHLKALYDGEIRLVDDHIGKLIRTIGLLGIAGKTIFVVTSDHGDEFFEHGRKGHHRTLYEEVLKVPFILYVPGIRPTSRTVSMETSIIDIMPTLLSITGIEIPRGTEGFDMSSVAYRGEAEFERSTHGELYRTASRNVQVSLQAARNKIIQEFFRLRIHSYNLALDPAELEPRTTHTGVATALASEMTGWLNNSWTIYSERLAHSGVNELKLDEETRERLESLGYTGD